MSEHACACGLTEALLQNQRGGEMFVCTHTSRGCNAELVAKLGELHQVLARASINISFSLRYWLSKSPYVPWH